MEEITKNRNVELENIDNNINQRILQDQYLEQYGLYRTRIQGDGNCLFRSISFSLYGSEDQHYALREVAVDHIRQNLDDFRFYLYAENGLPMTESEIARYLNDLGQLGTFAGQESILALSRVFNLNILVTIGGDAQNPEVNTLEHNFQNSDHIIHLVWTRDGGGHYEAVVENPAFKQQPLPTESFENIHRAPERDFSHYIWKSDEKNCRPFRLDNLDGIKDKKSHSQFMDHSYGRQSVKDPVVNSKSQSQCPGCRRTFYSKDTMMRHQRIHEKENVRNIHCSISSCSLTFHNVDVLVDHLRSFHGASIEVESLSFENIDLFEQFKQQESIRVNSRYVKQRQNKLNKDGSLPYTLVCHRNGMKRIHLKSGKTTKDSAKKIQRGHAKFQDYVLLECQMNLSL